jgi:hypothetical protein
MSLSLLGFGCGDAAAIPADGGDGGDAATDGAGDAAAPDARAMVESRFDGGRPPAAGFCDPEDVVDVPPEAYVEVQVNTEGATDRARPSLSCTVGADVAVPDAVLRYTPPASGTLVIDSGRSGTAAGLDTVVYVRDGCGGTGRELACNDDGGGRGTPGRVQLPVAAGEPLFVVVDGFAPADVGDVEVFLGIVAAPESSGPGAERCGDATELRFEGRDTPVMLATAAGDTTGASNESGCSTVPSTDNAPDHFFSFELDDNRDVVIDVAPGAGYDPALYLLSSCDGMELACQDTTSFETPERLVVEGLAPGRYILALDAFEDPTFGPFTAGAYELRVTATEAD